MTLRLRHPSSLVDLAECCGSGSPFRWAAVRGQAERGLSWSLLDEAGTALAAGGVLPGGGCWFVAAPAVGRHMLEMVRIAGRVLDTIPGPLAVDVRTEAGARIARLCGFRPCARGPWQRFSDG